MTERELLQRALDAMTLQEPLAACVSEFDHWRRTALPTIGAIRAHLAEPPAEPVASSLVRVFNEGYMLGHHDTVEAQFTDIHQSDMDTYHSELVSSAQPPAKPLTDEQIAACWPTNFAMPSNPRLPRFARAIEREVKRAHLAQPPEKPLTVEKIENLWSEAIKSSQDSAVLFARAIERAHGIT